MDSTKLAVMFIDQFIFYALDASTKLNKKVDGKLKSIIEDIKSDTLKCTVNECSNKLDTALKLSSIRMNISDQIAALAELSINGNKSNDDLVSDNYDLAMCQLYLTSSLLSINKEIADILDVDIDENYSQLMQWACNSNGKQ